MSILNSELDWSHVGSISTGPGTVVSDAFNISYGLPTKELLPAGTALYKFNGFSSLARPPITGDTPLSPWWSPVQPFRHDGGLQQRMLVAKLNGVSMREWGRLTSVIKENWSSLDHLLEIVLKVPVYAWFGGFKGMSRIDNGMPSKRNITLEQKGRGSNLPGGATQFYIPNLTVGHISSHNFSALK
uniref:EvpP n=1 Tax=Edwardsiella tarda TaxID=636 RepID=C4NTK4_EDWTA|nr:EvpP [Edwardsiella tarda]